MTETARKMKTIVQCAPPRRGFSFVRILMPYLGEFGEYHFTPTLTLPLEEERIIPSPGGGKVRMGASRTSHREPS